MGIFGVLDKSAAQINNLGFRAKGGGKISQNEEFLKMNNKGKKRIKKYP